MFLPAISCNTKSRKNIDMKTKSTIFGSKFQKTDKKINYNKIKKL